MSKWQKVKLGSINNYQSKSCNPMNEPDCNFELYSVPSYENAYPEIVTGAKIGSTKQMVHEGDVLLCKINPRINRVWSVKKHTKYPLIASSEWIVIRNNDIFTNYLVWCLKSKPFRNLMITNVTGIGGSLTRVQPKQVKEYPIPLPPLETQKQIAKTLDTAAELLAMRKRQLVELDNLIKSTFYEMFGDPVVNDKGWHTTLLGNCLNRIESGWSPKCEDRAVIEKEWGICKLSAVTGGTYKETENKAIFKDTKIDLALEVKEGDLLFSRKNTLELVGSSAYVFDTSKRLMIPDTIFRFCTKGNIHKLYLWGLLNCQTFKSVIRQLAGGTSGSMPNISKERLKGLKMPLPTLKKQNQFASIVIKIEEQKAIVKKAIRETQYLLDSMMSEYFE